MKLADSVSVIVRAPVPCVSGVGDWNRTRKTQLAPCAKLVVPFVGHVVLCTWKLTPFVTLLIAAVKGPTDCSRSTVRYCDVLRWGKAASKQHREGQTRRRNPYLGARSAECHRAIRSSIGAGIVSVDGQCPSDRSHSSRMEPDIDAAACPNCDWVVALQLLVTPVVTRVKGDGLGANVTVIAPEPLGPVNGALPALVTVTN